jgi:hypothetical protein
MQRHLPANDPAGIPLTECENVLAHGVRPPGDEYRCTVLAETIILPLDTPPRLFHRFCIELAHPCLGHVQGPIVTDVPVFAGSLAAALSSGDSLPSERGRHGA